MSRAPNVRLLFEGGEVEALATDTVASALIRAGNTTFSRGPKYHRPRGAFCLAGSCAQCHMRVDGEPNVPTCLTPVRDGLRVERQNVLGSGDTDLLRAVDFIYREGIDHHHLMTKFKALNQAAQMVARRLAGIGELPDLKVPSVPAPAMTAELVVIGAGKAGRAAAIAAASNGLDVTLLESAEAPAPIAHDRITLHSGTKAIALTGDAGGHLVLAKTAESLLLVTAKAVVVATGGLERPVPFESNDLPGVYAGRALLRFVRTHAVLPGNRVVVIGSGPDALAVARGLVECGAKLVAIVDPEGAIAPETGLEVSSGSVPVRAVGSSRVEALRVVDREGRESRLSCEVIAVVAALQPAYDLAAQAGAHAEYRASAGGFAIVLDERASTGIDWLFAAGRIAGEALPAAESGRLAGLAAASFLRPADREIAAEADRARSARMSALSLLRTRAE